MPNHILVEDIINDMIENISYIKVKSHLTINNK